MDHLLEFLARSLVDEPDAVSVTTAEEEDALVLELRVADDDAGQVIGRRGRTVSALRRVLRAVGAPQHQPVLVARVDCRAYPPPRSETRRGATAASTSGAHEPSSL